MERTCIRYLLTLLIGATFFTKTSFAQTCFCLCPSPEVGAVPFRQLFQGVESTLVLGNVVAASSIDTCTCGCPSVFTGTRFMNDVLRNTPTTSPTIVDDAQTSPTMSPTQCIALNNTCISDDTLPTYVPCCVGMSCRNIGPYVVNTICLVSVPSDAERDDNTPEYHPETDPARCPPGRARNEDCRRRAARESAKSKDQNEGQDVAVGD